MTTVTLSAEDWHRIEILVAEGGVATQAGVEYQRAALELSRQIGNIDAADLAELGSLIKEEV